MTQMIMCLFCLVYINYSLLNCSYRSSKPHPPHIMLLAFEHCKTASEFFSWCVSLSCSSPSSNSSSSLIFTTSRTTGPSCLLLTTTLLLPKYVIFKRIWIKVLWGDGKLFHSPFPDCHLQLNQPYRTLNALLAIFSLPCHVLYSQPQTWTPAHKLSWSRACTWHAHITQTHNDQLPVRLKQLE